MSKPKGVARTGIILLMHPATTTQVLGASADHALNPKSKEFQVGSFPHVCLTQPLCSRDVLRFS